MSVSQFIPNDKTWGFLAQKLFKWRRLCNHCSLCGQDKINKCKQMEGSLHIYYDQEGDFLEITLGNFPDSYVRDIDEGIFERIDEKTGKVVGIGILSFKKRTANQKDIDVQLPLKMALSS